MEKLTRPELCVNGSCESKTVPFGQNKITQKYRQNSLLCLSSLRSSRLTAANISLSVGRLIDSGKYSIFILCFVDRAAS
jgi:hypothetical protein